MKKLDLVVRRAATTLVYRQSLGLETESVIDG